MKSYSDEISNQSTIDKVNARIDDIEKRIRYISIAVVAMIIMDVIVLIIK